MVAAHSDYHDEDHDEDHEDGHGDGDWGAGRADVLCEEIRAAHTEMARAHARLLRLAAEYDRERYWEADGAHSNGEWLAWFLDLNTTTGRDWARTARRLQDLPALTDALGDADLSYDQVRVVARFAEPETDTTWVGRAQRHSPGELERIARHYRPVTSRESQDTHAGRWLHYHTDTTRRVLRGSFEVPEDDGATLVKGLERQVDLALTATRDDPDAEHVPYQARLADALVDLAATHITVDTDCDRATIVVQVPVTALTTQTESAGPGGWILAGPPISAETYGRDRYESRPHPFACDSRYQTVLYSEDGRARSVGSLQRSVPPHLSRIIRLRDVTCRWPGCERTSRLHIHHIVHWAQGGPTTTANCTAICPRHHRMVHETGYHIEGDADGTLTFKRPTGRTIDIRPPPPP